MKKQFAGIAAALLAGVMCFGLAACGENGSDKDNASGKDSASDKNGQTAGNQVTAEQWAAAMAYFDRTDAKFTIDATQTNDLDDLEGFDFETSEPILNAKLTVICDVHIVKNASKGYYKATGKAEGEEQFKRVFSWLVPQEEECYWEAVEGGYFRYVKDENEWFKRSVSEPYFSAEDHFFTERVSYADCTYSDTEKGYVVTGNFGTPHLPGTTNTLCFKFDAEGRLIGLTYSATGSSNSWYPSTLYFHTTETLVYSISYEAEEIMLPSATLAQPPISEGPDLNQPDEPDQGETAPSTDDTIEEPSDE